MKKISIIFTIVMFMIMMMGTGVVSEVKVEASTIKDIEYNLEQNLNDITLSWKKQSGVSYYNVYRVKLNDKEWESRFPKQKQYKKIAKVNSSINKYTDKKVKKGVKYSYIIKGYKEKKGKDKLVCTTFDKYSLSIAVSGLDKPIISNAGYGEDYSNTAETLYIGMFSEYGVEPTGYILYRKKEGEKSYKKIQTKKQDGDFYGVFIDDTVEPGCVYRYKLKAYKQVGKKKYYSKKSSYLKLSATNKSGKYDVEMMTYKGIDTSNISFRVTSNDKYNADTVFGKGNAMLVYQNTKKSEEMFYSIAITKYSLDNKIWMELPTEGIVLKANETIYLQGDLYEYDESIINKPVSIKFEETNPYIFYINWCYENNGIEYKGPGMGDADATFDFKKGTGFVFLEWD